MEFGRAKKTRRLYLEPDHAESKVPRNTMWWRNKCKSGDDLDASGSGSASDVEEQLCQGAEPGLCTQDEENQQGEQVQELSSATPSVLEESCEDRFCNPSECEDSDHGSDMEDHQMPASSGDVSNSATDVASSSEDEAGAGDASNSFEDMEDIFEGSANEPLQTGGGISKVQALLLMLMFVFKHSLSANAFSDLIKLVNVVLGSQVIPESLYKIKKAYRSFSEHARFHFFCPKSHAVILTTAQGCESKRKVYCSSCGTWHAASVGVQSNYFISLSAEHQIKAIIRRHGSFLVSERGATRPGEGMKDIHDGQFYKRLKNRFPLSRILTLFISTDGSPVFKSSKVSLWPIVAFLNELPRGIRFNAPILAGIWCHSGSVPVTAFFKAFCDEMKLLGSRGLSVILQGRRVVFRVFAICSSPDTLGRSQLQNTVRFNGYFGCSWCLHPGDKYTPGQVKYLFGSGHHELRTDRDMRRWAKDAVKTKLRVKGVKGPSCLSDLPQFDLVWSFVPDYMHCVCLGVVKMITEAWFDPKNRGQVFYLGRPSTLLKIDEKLTALRPPRVINRLPRQTNTRSYWKAAEWRAWLLFYALPCVNGVLSSEYASHFALLSASVYMLLKSPISEEDLRKADEMLFEFVARAQILYGKGFMTSNMHQLLHLADSARLFGPLWAHSAFPFEDWNGKLLRLVHGVRACSLQILERFSIMCAFQELSQSPAISSEFVGACKNILETRSWGSALLASLSRAGSTKTLSSEEKMAMRAAGLSVIAETVTSQEKLIQKGMIVTTVRDATRHCDNVVLIEGGLFLEIQAIVCTSRVPSDEPIVIGRKLIRLQVDSGIPSHIRKCRRDSVVAVRASAIQAKCLVMSMTDALYLSVLPTFEWFD